jgi:hypothetical protein
LGEGISANYIDGEWLGNLTTIDPKDGYWINVTGDPVLYVEGLPTDPETLYELHNGSNLISYPFADSAAIEQTIPEEAQQSILGIIGEGVSAMNNDGVWMGGLLALHGTKGYWFITSEAVDFTYNAPASGDGLTRQTKVRNMIIPEAYTFVQSTKYNA